MKVEDLPNLPLPAAPLLAPLAAEAAQPGRGRQGRHHGSRRAPGQRPLVRQGTGAPRDAATAVTTTFGTPAAIGEPAGPEQLSPERPRGGLRELRFGHRTSWSMPATVMGSSRGTPGTEWAARGRQGMAATWAPVRVKGAAPRPRRQDAENRTAEKTAGRADVRHAYALLPRDDVAGGTGRSIPRSACCVSTGRTDNRWRSPSANFARHPIRRRSSRGNTADIIGFASRHASRRTSAAGRWRSLCRGCAEDINPVMAKDVH